MGINVMYLLQQDGSICGGFSVQSDVSKIQDVVISQDWDELLSKREHRIIDSAQLASGLDNLPSTNNCHWRMELFPLEGQGPNVPTFSCTLQRQEAHALEARQSEIDGLRTIIDAMPFGVAVIRRDKRVYIMNKAALKLAGYTSMEEYEGLHQTCQETFCPAPKGECPVWDKGQRFDKTERPFLMRDGSQIHVLKSAVPVNIEGEMMMLEGIIDLRKQKDLERLAFTDPLTGTLNRKGFRERFDAFSENTKIDGERYTMIMLDFDDFKDINDGYGHFAGDHVLRFFVQTMKQELQEDDIFCRWGGDEFLIVTNSDAETCTEKLLRVKENVKTNDFGNKNWRDISLEFSAGIVTLEPGMTLEQMIHKADGHMYHAKRSGSGIYNTSTPLAE